MKITRLKDELKNPCGLNLALDEKESIQLRQILNRALNTWPEAPADFKSLSDLLDHGRILQPYTDN
jgi:hypothetical protein